MNEPLTPVVFPSIQVAKVIGYDAEQNSVLVQLQSGQFPVIPARMSYRGNADQYRIEQEPLPLVGTWGVIAFPGNDDRFPIWLGAYYPNITNAITSSPVLQDSQIKYFSHWSGYYSKLDGQGNLYVRLPEGTNLIANPDNTIPVIFRHVFSTTIEDNNEIPQARIEFPDSERVPSPPPVFWLSINHPSGASTSCTPLGVVTWQAGNPQLASWVITPSGVATLQTGVNGGPGVQTGPTAVWDGHQGLITITGANGHSSITMNVSGEIKATAASGNSNIFMDKDGAVTATAAAGHSQIIMDKDGNITIKTDNGQINIEADAGNIFLNTQTHTDSVDTIINTFNAHTHSGVTSGTSNSGPPNSVLP